MPAPTASDSGSLDQELRQGAGIRWRRPAHLQRCLARLPSLSFEACVCLLRRVAFSVFWSRGAQGLVEGRCSPGIGRVSPAPFEHGKPWTGRRPTPWRCRSSGSSSAALTRPALAFDKRSPNPPVCQDHSGTISRTQFEWILRWGPCQAVLGFQPGVPPRSSEARTSPQWRL